MTDNLRIILWAALAAMLFFNYQAWQQQYARPGLASEPAAVGSPAEPATDDLPAFPEMDVEATDGDLPTIAGGTVDSTGPVITVETDVLSIEIGSRGGDIRRALLKGYPQEKSRPDVPVELLNPKPASLFVFRTGLRAAGGRDEATHKSIYTSARTAYSLADGDDVLEVPLRWESPEGITIEKTYRFRRGRYDILLDFSARNDSETPYSVANYLQLQRVHLPLERSMFNVDSYSFTGPVVYDGDKYEKLDVDDLEDGPFNLVVNGGWIASIQHHFLAAAVPEGTEQETYQVTYDGKQYLMTAIGPVTTIEPGMEGVFTSKLFIGPKLQQQLNEVSDGLALTVDYGVLAILAQPLFWLLGQVHNFVGNWGWSIIIVTFLIKLVFYPLTEKSGRSMAKMRNLQPRLKALQDRHKDDRQAMSQALMDLYKREKVNPVAGCLPMLIQIPFFIAFYWVLLESVEMRQAPFMLWITDLSIRDPYFVLPLLMGAAMFGQQKLNPAPPDPVQAKVMTFLPVMFTVFFAFFPAGLVLYWLTNSVLSILQQWRINRVVSGAH
jgi:YidC/Oxa1 family membrane protein insertase